MTNHLGETSLRMEILGILLHVLGEGVDSIGKDSDLNLRRTGVILIDLVLCDNGGFGFLGNHFFFTFLKITPKPEYSAGETHELRKEIFQTEQGHTLYQGIGHLLL